MSNQKEQIALYKYKIIAPVIYGSQTSQQLYFEEQANKEHVIPGREEFPIRFKPGTFKKWLHLYKKKDFEGLKPSDRCDKGTFRNLSDDIDTKIRELLKNNVFRTIKNLHNFLIDTNELTEDTCTYQTFCNYIKSKQLWDTFQTQKKRKSWEKPYINMLWTGDFTYSIYINVGKNKKKQVYFCSFIDDYSRLIVGGEFSFTMDTIAMENVLKKAFCTYGIPQAIYLDNGGPFVQESLVMTGAKLGFQVIHSKPGDPCTRGKKERFYRTLKDKFVTPLLLRHNDEAITLDFLNEEFKKWVYNDYHHHLHSGIEMTPHDKYMNNKPQVNVRMKERDVIEQAFLHSISRKVSGDALVSIDSVKYEVPGQFINKQVELRFNPANSGTFLIYEENVKEPHLVKPVDRHANSYFNKPKKERGEINV
jgi:transposase InsO family protein